MAAMSRIAILALVAAGCGGGGRGGPVAVPCAYESTGPATVTVDALLDRRRAAHVRVFGDGVAVLEPDVS
jgi:hypothetical protein